MEEEEEEKEEDEEEEDRDDHDSLWVALFPFPQFTFQMVWGETDLQN